MEPTTESAAVSSEIPPGPESIGRKLRRRALLVVGVYAAAAATWIALSDPILAALVSDPATLVKLSVFKGFAFVAVTAALLYLLLHHQVRTTEAAFTEVAQKELDRRAHETERQRAHAAAESAHEAALAAATTAERERRLAASLIEAMPGVFYLYDEDGRFLRWNRNFEVVSGYSPDEVARMHPLDFFGEHEKDLLRTRIAAVFAHGDANVEASFVTKDGRALPHYFTGRQITLDGRRCLIGVGVDIGERRRAERALHELNEGLERRIRERTAELEAALVRAESADKLKSAFLATMSHELRTPLNSIIGFTGIILQGLAGPLNDEQTKQLGMVQGSARHLLDLINDVLDISKIEAGQLEMRNASFDPSASIEQVVATVAPLAARKGLALRTELDRLPPAMASDRRRFEQILINLVNNAIKFTQRGEVVIGAALTDAFIPRGATAPVPALRVAVRDTGIGMKREDLASLFQPFRQIDSGLQRPYEGTGLGLAICHRLVGLLGGAIRVESTWGEGSTFMVELPLEPR